MHHILTKPFQNCFWLPKHVFKIAIPSFGLKSHFFNKSTSISKEHGFKTSWKVFPFSKESNFSSILHLIWFKSYLQNSLKSDLLSKSVTNLLPKNKIFPFNQQSVFKPNIFWLDFVLNAFDLTLRAKSFSKINIAFKKNGLQLIY